MRAQSKGNEAWLSLVERCVRDAEVASSNLVASTLRPVGQAVKTTPSHGVNPGSIPGQVIKGYLISDNLFYLPFCEINVKTAAAGKPFSAFLLRLSCSSSPVTQIFSICFFSSYSSLSTIAISSFPILADFSSASSMELPFTP